MKNYPSAFLFFILALLSCENNDFCSEVTTPRLILSFYDNDDPENLKKVPIYVWAENKDTVYDLAIVDSIFVPLNTKNNSTIYNLSTTNIVDTINLSYLIEDVFVSKPCGYKSIFKNLSHDNNYTKNWIKKMEVSNANIEDETATHIKIYH